MQRTMTLPKHIQDFFYISAKGQLQAEFASAVACRTVEVELAENEIPYKTQIVKSRQRGILYKIIVLGSPDYEP
jgi:hypothetical protein